MIEAHLKSQPLRLPRIRVRAIDIDQGQSLLLPFQSAEEKKSPTKRGQFQVSPSYPPTMQLLVNGCPWDEQKKKGWEK